jgi:signal transduction histidine kinase
VAGNQLWLATSKGLQAIPLNYIFSKPLPSIVLSEISVNGKKYSSNFIQLNHNATLTIKVNSINFASLNNFQFAYRLISRDTHWVMTNAINENIVLSGILAGNFKVEVKAVDYLGRFSANSIIIVGKVIPPFWQRWWFYILVAASGIALAYFVFLLRIKSLRIKQQQAIEKLALENELKLSQQTALKAQMNPHFLFNVLNSIKSFIYENDKKSAAEYLSKFAELVRGILTMSSLPMVKLSDEIKALELYIQLEAMLLEPPFEYTLTVDKSIDAAAISIPSLIIQPFIENSFKHGLRHKPGAKNLQIRIELNDAAHQLKVSIEDNGIGRAQSAVLNSKNSPSHQSFATQANAQRLALLNKDADEKVSVQFEDKVDEQEMANGTIVILNIAL